MKTTLIIIFALMGFIQNSQNCDKKTMSNEKITVTPTPKKNYLENLPENITPETKVRNEVKNEKGETISSDVTTVEKLLKQLKARYENDKLVDAKGREIKFFEPLCRGTSEGFEADQKAGQEKGKELDELQKKYTVIVIYCDPTKVV